LFSFNLSQNAVAVLSMLNKGTLTSIFDCHFLQKIVNLLSKPGNFLFFLFKLNFWAWSVFVWFVEWKSIPKKYSRSC